MESIRQRLPKLGRKGGREEGRKGGRIRQRLPKLGRKDHIGLMNMNGNSTPSHTVVCRKCYSEHFALTVEVYAMRIGIFFCIKLETVIKMYKLFVWCYALIYYINRLIATIVDSTY